MNELNNTVYCKIGASPIEGVGVFAIRDIPEGQRLTDFDGRKFTNFELSEEEFNGLDPDVRTLILERTHFDQTKPLIFMSPNCTQVLGAFINHSSEPNTDGEVALRDIHKGEEITKDYKLMTPTPHEFTREKLKGIICS